MAESVQTPFHRYQPGAAQAPEALPGISFNAVTEIVVTHEPVTGEPVALLRDTHYTIALPSGVADGTITAIGVWPTGDIFHAERVTPRGQLIAFEPHKVPPGPVIEEGLDQLMRIAQEQDAKVARAVSVPLGEAGFRLPAASLRNGGVAQFTEDGLIALPLAELGALLSADGAAGLTAAYSGDNRGAVASGDFDPPGIGAGGYYIEFAVSEAINFVRFYARVFAGTGTCDIEVRAGGLLLSQEDVGPTATDRVVDVTVPVGRDLVVTVKNIVGTITGLVVKLEGAPA